MPRPYSRHGLHLLKRRVMVQGLNSLDRRAGPVRALFDRRAELIEALGGEQTVTPQQTALIELATRTRLYVKDKLEKLGKANQEGVELLSPLARRVPVSALLDDLEADYRLRQVKSWPQIQSHLKPIREHFGPWRAAEVNHVRGRPLHRGVPRG